MTAVVCRAVVTRLALVVMLVASASLQGAQENSSAPRSPAGLETIQVRPNVYVIFGAGANIVVHVGSDGLVVVDTGSADMAAKVLQSIKAISPKPIRLIINTTADADHVGGNGVLGDAGVSLSTDPFSQESHATVLAHENVLLKMSAPTGSTSPFPTSSWPNDTFTSRFRSLYVNDDALQVIRQTGAHSDADAMALFRTADVIVTGDVVDLRQFPVIDPARGGSIQGELEGLNRLLTEFVVPRIPQVLKPGGTVVIPGHGYVSDYAEVVEYRDTVTVVTDIIQDMIAKGMTLAQVKAANPTKGYRARFGSDAGPWTTDRFVEAVYNGLKKK
jgi:glyoxylase-like metal-dependent hydrolase (beta-lactamase superfamily II)